MGLFGRKLSNAKHAWDYFAMIIVKVYRLIEKEERSVIIGIKTSKALVLLTLSVCARLVFYYQKIKIKTSKGFKTVI